MDKVVVKAKEGTISARRRFSNNAAEELRLEISLSGDVVDQARDNCTFKEKDKC